MLSLPPTLCWWQRLLILCFSLWSLPTQATPLVAGLAVGAAAYAGKLAIEMAMKMRAAPRLRNFYKVHRASRGFGLHPGCPLVSWCTCMWLCSDCDLSLCEVLQLVREGGRKERHAV